jgi:hypothetical protein
MRLLFLFLILPCFVSGQDKTFTEFKLAEALLNSGKTKEAYVAFKNLKPKVEKTDTIYNYTMWYYTNTAAALEHEHRMKEDFAASLQYGLDALSIIKEGKELFDEEYAVREAWMVKNIIVSYFGLGQVENAKKYQDILYKGYKEKTLPAGIDGYYNFDFFTLEGKNIWGYEWYPETWES